MRPRKGDSLDDNRQEQDRQAPVDHKALEEIEQAQELEDLLGIREMNPYRTLNKDIFASKLEDMSLGDMTSLALHVGVTPQQNSKQLKKGLLQSFELYARKHNVNVPSAAKPIIDQNSPNYKKTVKLFKDI